MRWCSSPGDSLAGEGGTEDCGNDLREGKGDAMGLDVRELAMVELLDKEGEEVDPSSLPSRFLLRRGSRAPESFKFFR